MERSHFESDAKRGDFSKNYNRFLLATLGVLGVSSVVIGIEAHVGVQPDSPLLLSTLGAAGVSGVVLVGGMFAKWLMNNDALEFQAEITVQDSIDYETGQLHLFEMRRTYPDYAKTI